MSSQDGRSPFAKDTYGRQTLRPLNCLVFILPLLAVFHVGTAFYGSDLLAPRDIDSILGYFGVTVAYLPAMLVVVVLLLQHVAHREKFRVQGRVLAGMLGESICWVLPLIAMAHLTNRLLLHQAGADQGSDAASGVFPLLISGVGAGIYEEFIFRMVLISLSLVVFVDVFDLHKDTVAIVSVIAAAIAFSLYHFSVKQIAELSTFPWYDFIFRAVAGVYLGSLYVFRGFGIAVGVHSIYNIYTVLYNM